MPSGIRTRTSGIMVPAFVAPTTTAYAGPGDQVATWWAWWGLRAFSAATRGNLAVDLKYNDTVVLNYTTDATTGQLPLSTIAADTTTHGSPVKINRLYDQTGNGRHLDTDAGGGFPTWTPNAIGLLPAMTFTRGGMNLEKTVPVTIPQPFVLNWVAKRTGSTASLNCIIALENAGLLQSGFPAIADTIRIYAGTATIDVTATDNVLHSAICYYNGASSELYVDGSAPATVNIGSNGFSASPIGFGGVDGTNGLDGIIAEGGVIDSGLPLSAGQKNNLYNNQKNYYTPAIP